jgi:hypothetical protein
MRSASEKRICIYFVRSGYYPDERANMHILPDRQPIGAVKIKMPVDEDSARDRKVFRPEESPCPDDGGAGSNCGIETAHQPHPERHRENFAT